MTRRGRIVVGIVATGMILAALLVANNWYYNKYEWPEQIQKELFGKQIVDSRALIYREGFSHFGEGRFLWRYRITSETPELMKFCHHQPLAKCDFRKFRKREEGVALDSTYSEGVLTLEEVWS